GAESGATLGALWLYDAWLRNKVMPIIGVGAGNRLQKEGQDISCAIWLSITPSIGAGNRRYNMPVDNWVKSPVRDKVPMYFLYGEQDNRAAHYAKHLCDSVMRATGDTKLKNTGKMPLPTKLAGRELLGKPSLDTEDKIIRYIKVVVEDRGKNPWNKHN